MEYECPMNAQQIIYESDCSLMRQQKLKSVFYPALFQQEQVAENITKCMKDLRNGRKR